MLAGGLTGLVFERLHRFAAFPSRLLCSGRAAWPWCSTPVFCSIPSSGTPSSFRGWVHHGRSQSADLCGAVVGINAVFEQPSSSPSVHCPLPGALSGVHRRAAAAALIALPLFAPLPEPLPVAGGAFFISVLAGVCVRMWVDSILQSGGRSRRSLLGSGGAARPPNSIGAGGRGRTGSSCGCRSSFPSENEGNFISGWGWFSSRVEVLGLAACATTSSGYTRRSPAGRALDDTARLFLMGVTLQEMGSGLEAQCTPGG